MSETPQTPTHPERQQPSEEMLERYRTTSKLILNDRSERKLEFNLKAKATINLMREVMPELDDMGIFVVLSSVSYMLSSLMTTPVAKISEDLEEMFDVYALASAACIGAVDLSDETVLPSKTEQREMALREEIVKLRRQLAGEDNPDDNPGTGLYL